MKNQIFKQLLFLLSVAVIFSSCMGGTKSNQQVTQNDSQTMEELLGTCPNEPFMHYAIVPAINNGKYTSGCGLVVVSPDWNCLAYQEELDFSVMTFTQSMKCAIADALYTKYLINNDNFNLQMYQDVITCIEFVDEMYMSAEKRSALGINEEMYSLMESVSKANWEKFDPIKWKITSEEQLFAYEDYDATNYNCLKVCKVNDRVRSRHKNLALDDIPDEAILICLSIESKTIFEE